ncbi:hypothetical protein ISF_08979 [Cordyceps fumosorosea ARSEF 2679]|uniref:Uncharacterized protein n=1 Tax=Cordyceps fumosorosea (strain ARSEF 2679) TaxID=1081104 RepID=A0A162K490_CORFA|nr:hypothetical protein ISF_08979 [Cordyceps fumosorosea ARSEF 2679]OAA53138.1 hypothetical protein ISF_08979 [Cordyceps fumosorosea ARSEF 2679]
MASVASAPPRAFTPPGGKVRMTLDGIDPVQFLLVGVDPVVGMTLDDAVLTAALVQDRGIFRRDLLVASPTLVTFPAAPGPAEKAELADARG